MAEKGQATSVLPVPPDPVPILSRSVLILSKSCDTVPWHSNSQYQNFPDCISRYQNIPHRFQYCPTPSTNTFQVINLGIKTIQIASNTFLLTVLIFSNIQLVSIIKIVQNCAETCKECKKAQKNGNSANKCRKLPKVQKTAQNGKK